MGGHAAALAVLELAARGGGRLLQVELLLLGHVAALREEAAAAAGRVIATAPSQEHDHHDRGDGHQRRTAVADEPLALLIGARLCLALLALAAQCRLLFLAVCHNAEA